MTVRGPNGAISSAPQSKKKAPRPLRATSYEFSPQIKKGERHRSPLLATKNNWDSPLLWNLIFRHAVVPRFVLQRADFRLDTLALFLQIHKFHVPIVDFVAGVRPCRDHGVSVQH